jgi:transketolase
MDDPATLELARSIRGHVLRMVHHAQTSHAGSALSMTDILAVLYGGVLRIDPDRPDDPSRDRVIVSKGHGGAAVYAALALRGFFPVDWLQRYCDDDNPLAGHLTHHGVPGVEASTGSLGHGLSIACGLALAGGFHTYAVLSDGELDEGSVWEAILFAGHRGLTNLTAVVDYNKIQSFGRTAEVLDLEPLVDKFAACGWQVKNIDGHDHRALTTALQTRGSNPVIVIANTVKGKGVSFMEDRLEWHYRSPDDVQLEAALRELGETL